MQQGTNGVQLNGATSSASEADTNGHALIGDSLEPSSLALDKINQDIVRLIGQHLKSVGLKRSLEQLMEESGCNLEHPLAAHFKDHVLQGEWTKADHYLEKLKPFLEEQWGKKNHIVEMKFLLLEQKYLEHLEDGRPLDALHVLRNELTPLQHNTPRVHQLSSYMMCSENVELYERAQWEGKGVVSRTRLMDRLHAFLPPNVMLPPRRLHVLLTQALDLQMKNCNFHNTSTNVSLENTSLLRDHVCSSDSFPMNHLLTLNEHCDEVWFCQFSPDGLKLATGSKDTTVVIWDVDPVRQSLTHRRTFEGHTYGVSQVIWSPDGTHLLAIGPEDCPEISIWNMETEELRVKMTHAQEDSLTCAAWYKDGTKFVTGGVRGQFYKCDLEGNILDSWEGVRVTSLKCRADGKTVLAADTHKRIRSYVFEELVDCTIIQEDYPVMSFVMDRDDRLAMLNISGQGCHLWDMQDKCLIRKFQGVSQGHFTIHGSFGGVNQDYYASGSEDHKVFIYHLKQETPIATLYGHTRAVNCVSWNPVYPNLLVSASDDNTIRLWGPKSCTEGSTNNSVMEHDDNPMDVSLESVSENLQDIYLDRSRYHLEELNRRIFRGRSPASGSS